jgi:hypothetical protein
MDPKIELPNSPEEEDVARAFRTTSFTDAYVLELRLNRELASDIRTMQALDGTRSV